MNVLLVNPSTRSGRLVDVDHAGGDVDRVETRGHHERMQLAADQRVAAGRLLEPDLALDRRMRGGAVGVEAGRSMIALDDGDAATGAQEALQRDEGGDRAREVLEDEADEDVVEDPSSNGRSKMSPWRNSTFVSPAASARRVASATDCSETSTDVNRACGLRRASVMVWAPTPHPASSTLLPRG